MGGYELEAELGSGASGTVWRARRRGPLRQPVALKRLRAGAADVDLARLRHEATVLAELDHPHVVRILEVVEDDGLAVVMQLATGGSLEDLLAARPRLAPGEVVAVAVPLADALASAHRRGVLHGDVKPANVLFTSDGEPLLSDFGVARWLAARTTASASVGGTPEYLAPEVLDGSPPDPSSDVYALGVVCYEALAGWLPYTGATPLAVVRAADRGEHPPLAEVEGVPRALAEAVERALARSRDDRTASADELSRALRASLPAGEVALPGPAPARPAGTVSSDRGRRGTRTFGPRPSSPGRASGGRRRWPLVAGVAVLAVGLPVLWLRQREDEPTTSTTRCTDPEPEVPEGAELLQGDFDGDGCLSFAVRQGVELAAPVDREEDGPRRYRIGEDGDRLLLGDWNCDLIDTPGLYRPATGEVFYFDAWTEPGAPLAGADPVLSGQLGATPRLGTAEGTGCDAIVLEGGTT